MKNNGRRRASAKAVAGIWISRLLLVYLACSWLHPLFPAEPAPLSLTGTWTVVSKAQPLGHVVWPSVVGVDGEGALYVPDYAEGGRIQKRDSNGHWSLVASVNQSPGGLKRLVWAMAVDRSGSVYVPQPEGIFKRDNQGNWTTLAKWGKESGLVKGASALAVDRAGNLYVVDGWGDEAEVLLRKPDGQWTRLVVHGNQVGEVSDLHGLAVDAEGNLYLTDRPPRGKRIQKRDRTGHWSVVDQDAMSGRELGSPLASVVTFDKVACDASGALYVSVTGPEGPLSVQLLKRDAEGRWIELAVEGSGIGQLSGVSSVSVDSTGALYVAEIINHRVQRRDADGTWTVVCETSREPGGFVRPASPVLDSPGNLYVVDSMRGLVQKRDAEGRWTVVVEVPRDVIEVRDSPFPIGVDPRWPLPFWVPVFSLFGELTSIAVDRQDNLYVADGRYKRIMKLNTHGQWELCLPPGEGDGQSQTPERVSVDALDNLYVIDGGRQLHKRDPEGQWTILAGGAGWLRDVCAAPSGIVYVASVINDQMGIRVPDSHGGWTVVASQGSGLGQVAWPGAMAADAIGRLYIADLGNQRLQVRDVDGKWFVLSADTNIGLQNRLPPVGIAVDGKGVVYITHSHRVFCWMPQPKPQAPGRVR